jgi:hypothetical protein
MQIVLRYLKTLADQTRLRLIGLLASQQRNVEELAALLNLKSSTVSWHLGKLKELELVDMRAEGNTHVYRLNGKGLGRINKLLGARERIALWVEEEVGDVWERKVIADYVMDGRLKTIPAYRKKLEIILRWLANQFTYGRSYPEHEVNTILGRFHEDTATLRRELIGYKLLQRDHGVYWRPEPPSGQSAHSPSAHSPKADSTP